MLSSRPRLLATLGWIGFGLATFAFAWFVRLSPGNPFLLGSMLGSSLLGISSGAIEFSKYIFLGSELIDSMGTSTGILETFCGAGAGAFAHEAWRMYQLLPC